MSDFSFVSVASHLNPMSADKLPVLVSLADHLQKLPVKTYLYNDNQAESLKKNYLVFCRKLVSKITFQGHAKFMGYTGPVQFEN